MSEEKAPFNSALDLLERLSNILTTITKVKQNIYLDKDEKQGYVLELTKDYYLQAIPLLSEESRDSLKYILDVKQKEAVVIEDYGRQRNRKKIIYSDEIEKIINETIIKIQIDLQDLGKYFMPPRKKLGKVVGEFN